MIHAESVAPLPNRPGQVVPHSRIVPIPPEEVARRTKIIREAILAEAHAAERLRFCAPGSAEEAKLNRDRAHWIKVRRRELAAIDSAAFCEYTLRTEKGNRPIRNAPVHKEWHGALATFSAVVVWAGIEMGKTQSVTVGYTLWRLGRDPDTRIVVVSDPLKKAMKIGRTLQHYIERSDELHEVFPMLRRSHRAADPWGASAFTVERPSFSAKDPSVQCTGVKGSVSGSRTDLAHFDDAVTYRNSSVKEQREELSRWSMNEVFSRLGDGGQSFNGNTAFHPEDLTNERAKIPGTFARRYAVRDHSGQPRTPNWHAGRYEAMERRLGGPNGVETRRQLLVEDVGDEDSRFEDDWIKQCISDEYALTWSLSKEERDQIVEMGGVLVAGGDYAAAPKRGGARKKLGGLTSFTVLAVYPDGVHQILWIEAGRWKAPEIRERMINIHRRFGAVFFVEDNGVQSWVIENVEEISDTPMVPHTTGANKHDPTFGVESIGVQMYQGKWIIPRHPAASGQLITMHPKFGPLPAEVAAWVDELKAFSPIIHSGDRLMSLWTAKEGARTLRAGRGGSVSVVEVSVPREHRVVREEGRHILG